jgi:hypothetical protein
MATYHLSAKTISRSHGRSATAAAAYRSGARIADERTGVLHDYRRRRGVEASLLILPDDAPDWACDRARLWNAAEQAETRKNSTVAREFEIALPAELDAGERQRLAADFARELVLRHGCAADVAIHRPGRTGDSRNHHAHILLTTRRLTAAGFTEKTRELDDLKTGEIGRWRERFADLQNARLREAGVEARVDHRSLEAQDSDRAATIHLGPTATALERRGVPTRLGESNRAVQASNAVRQRDAGRQALLRADIPALEREWSEWTRHREWLARHEPPPASWLADRWGELAQAQRAATAAGQALDAAADAGRYRLGNNGSRRPGPRSSMPRRPLQWLKRLTTHACPPPNAKRGRWPRTGGGS